jgi:hypothetical protein
MVPTPKKPFSTVSVIFTHAGSLAARTVVPAAADVEGDAVRGVNGAGTLTIAHTVPWVGA